MGTLEDEVQNQIQELLVALKLLQDYRGETECDYTALYVELQQAERGKE